MQAMEKMNKKKNVQARFKQVSKYLEQRSISLVDWCSSALKESVASPLWAEASRVWPSSASQCQSCLDIAAQSSWKQNNNNNNRRQRSKLL